jgi:hypothetical protein
MRDKKVDLTPLIEAEEPVVIVVLTRRGLEKSLLFYQEDSVEALEAGNRLLTRVSAHLVLLDNTLRAAEQEEQVSAHVMKMQESI